MVGPKETVYRVGQRQPWLAIGWYLDASGCLEIGGKAGETGPAEVSSQVRVAQKISQP